jgi:hypothetical protein
MVTGKLTVVGIAVIYILCSSLSTQAAVTDTARIKILAKSQERCEVDVSPVIRGGPRGLGKGGYVVQRTASWTILNLGDVTDARREPSTVLLYENVGCNTAFTLSVRSRHGGMLNSVHARGLDGKGRIGGYLGRLDYTAFVRFGDAEISMTTNGLTPAERSARSELPFRGTLLVRLNGESVGASAAGQFEDVLTIRLGAPF